MDTFLVRLWCHSPYLTPWRNCTLWGRMSWIVADGRLPGWTIEDWVAFVREGLPPLVVSDAFPYDAVPVPALHLAKASGDQKRPKALPWPEWLTLCQTGMWPERVATPRLHRSERTHVVISRDTGTALEGQLRTELGLQPVEGLVVVARVDPSLGRNGLELLFEELCREGWGQGRTCGYGQIEIRSVEPLSPVKSDGWITTLGHCHPTDDLPEEGFWRWTGVPVRPHNPETRKGPVQFFTTMLSPGACFPKKADEDWVGRTLDLPNLSACVHCGLAPTWPLAGESYA